MNEALWTRVQAALDERRDPLGDPEVRAWMLEHPDDALALADLRAALAETERADNPLRAARRSRFVPVVAAGLALAALGAWLSIPSRTASEDLELHPIVAAPALGCVRSWSIVSTSESPECTQTVRASQGRIETENDYRAPLGTLAQAIVLVRKAESWSPQ